MENIFSFVVGFGNNPPTQPHHRGSSCPRTGVCYHAVNRPNPNVLYGALVGGPKERNDQFSDKRRDWVESEVTLDYNAAYQALLAGVIEKFC